MILILVNSCFLNFMYKLALLIHVMIKYSSFLFFVFLFFSCATKKSNSPINDESIQLMQGLEKSYYSGDSIDYKKWRAKIKNEIHTNHNKKVQLYLASFDATQLFNQAKSDEAEKQFTKIYYEALKHNEPYSVFSSASMLGNIAFYNNNIKSAINYWKRSVDVAKRYQELNKYASASLVNIGSGYMKLGYYSTSTDFFIQAKEEMDKTGKKDENYWLNLINISDAYLSIDKPEKAVEDLKQINKHYSPRVNFFYHLNLASAYLSLNQKNNFIAYIDSSRQLISKNKESVYSQLSLELDGFEKFDLKEKLKITIQNYLADTTQKSIELNCIFNNAYFTLFNKYYNTINEMVSWENQLDSSDYTTNEIYHRLLSNVYHKIGNTGKEIIEFKKQQSFYEKLTNEKLKNKLEDYTLNQMHERVKNQNKLLQDKISTSHQQLQTQKIIFILIGITSLVVLSLIILLFINFKKSKKINEQKLKLTQLEVIKSEVQKEALTGKLEIQNQKLKNTLALINKVEILKKQLNDFFDESETFDVNEITHKKIKSAKLDFKSFFSIYSDLAIQASIKDDGAKFIKILENKAPQLNKKELQVAQLILNEFTTKEIALLLTRSVKNIEFIRTEIRKKLQIPAEKQLNDYLKELMA